jgi:hypothetical protein
MLDVRLSYAVLKILRMFMILGSQTVIKELGTFMHS